MCPGKPKKERPPRNVLEAVKRGSDYFEPVRQPKPTDAMPGTWEKISILRDRIERGEELWHDRDRTIRPGPVWLELLDIETVPTRQPDPDEGLPYDDDE